MTEKYYYVSTHWLRTQLAIKLNNKEPFKDILNEIKRRNGRPVGMNMLSQIEIILNEFNFIEAAEICAQRGYLYYETGINSELILPTVDSLKNMAINMLTDVWTGPEDLLIGEYYHQRYRLKACRRIHNGYKILSLELMTVYSDLDYDWVVNG